MTGIERVIALKKSIKQKQANNIKKVQTDFIED